MKPILQTKFGGEKGNCLAACICSILEIDNLEIFDNIPNDERWFSYVNDILDKYDIFLCLMNFENPTYAIQGYHLIIGDNLNKPYSHCQVGYNGSLFFDPMGTEIQLKNHRYGLFMKKFTTIMDINKNGALANNSSEPQKNEGPMNPVDVKLDFGQAIQALKQGKRVAREGWNWKGLFVFMQIPSEINEDVIPKMQSLPQSVKDEFARRGGSISYSNQMAIVNTNNSINGWSPSSSDTLAEDWVILD